MELRCNSSDSSTNSNACLTPGPPCCEMYSSRFASAARFTTTHLRNGGIVRAMCHNASIGVFGSLADCGVSARGGGGGCSRPLFGVCAVCSVLANRFALLRRRGACDAVRDAACLRRAARSGMPARRAGMHGLRARAWGSASIISFFLLSLLSSVRRCFRIASASRGPAADCADASIPRESAHSRPTRTRNAP